MDAEELYQKVKHHLFEPFRVHVSDGSSYEVCHPDQIMVGRRSSHVGVSNNGDRPFQRILTIANMHITKLEPME